MKPLQLFALFFITSVFLGSGDARAHGDPGIPLYVADDGVDEGACTDAGNPCATISFALTRAGKGATIRVSEGSYALDNVEDLFHILGGVVEVNGGYRKPGKSKMLPTGATTLTGVPFEYRDQLESRGFRVVADQKGNAGERVKQTNQLLQMHNQLKSSISFTPCVGGSAAGLPCDRIDLLSHVGLCDISGAPENCDPIADDLSGADVWGFVDLNTGREYAIMGVNFGTAVFDVTDPTNPREVGFVAGQDVTWRDIKVFQYFNSAANRWNAYAYVTADGQTTDGLFVIDMTGLPHTIRQENYFSDFANAHNVYATNTDYSTGLSVTDDTPTLVIAGSDLPSPINANISGVYRSYSLANPAAPNFVSGGTGSGYMHDASSVIITDARKDTQCVNAGAYCEVLLDFNENTIEIWDVTDTANPVQLSNTPYGNVGYVHSGWWSEDRQYIFVHDELDERNRGLPTTLRIFSISDLTQPTLAGIWSGVTDAIDHNGFVRGNRYYMSNYTRGLTILDITDPATPAPIGRLDTYPMSDITGFFGAWGVYPFFHSGNIAISDIDSGFYMAADNTLDVAEGSFSFAAVSASAVEGQQAQVTVQRTGGTSGTTSVNYEVVHATADGSDYQLASGAMNWTNGDSSDRTIDIDIVNDGVSEGLERLLIRLVDPRGGATLATLNTASLYISDAGSAPAIMFAESAIETTEEGFGTLIVVLQRTGSAVGAVSVDYSLGNANATAGTDYQGSTSGTVTWEDGDANPRFLEFSVENDGVQEIDEFFSIVLNNPVGGTIAGTNILTATIRDGDGSSPPPPPPPVTPPTSGGGGGAPGWPALLFLFAVEALRRRTGRQR